MFGETVALARTKYVLLHRRRKIYIYILWYILWYIYHVHLFSISNLAVVDVLRNIRHCWHMVFQTVDIQKISYDLMQVHLCFSSGNDRSLNNLFLIIENIRDGTLLERQDHLEVPVELSRNWFVSLFVTLHSITRLNCLLCRYFVRFHHALKNTVFVT